LCGIFGIVTDSESVPDRARLDASMHALDHRGPDSRKIHAGPGAGFAHTRLSFVDVDARSDQPFWDVSGRYALIFNGEIYNYRQLRAQLESEGVAFRTTSDTEVLLQMLLYRDPDTAIRALEGMFAFALFDSADRSLLMARDRFGMKPLFIQQVGEAFLFGSEVKAFAPWTPPRVDRFMVASYLLSFRGPTSGFTFLDDVTAVPPGQIVVKRPGSAPQFRAFARLEDFLTPAAIDEYAALSSTQIVDHMEQLLSASVEAHLLADVPVGAFCSGGVDSSLLMGIAARRHNNLAIFHANVKGPFSEVAAAAALSKHLKLDLKAVDVEEREFIDLLPRAIRHFEQPLADRPNCVPMMQVACLARDNKVKGLLSGEGSDECFLGYPWLGRKALTDGYYALGTKLRGGVRALPGVGDLLWPVPEGNVDLVRSLFNRREVADDAERVAAAVAALG
ncbi:MAG TPA: asparagine synthase (glutamine-hydrolyzing), partial [Polymorphobacter sp.]|nr:asparagine synthase (glutamine-hydrolyzing) [Polymorphobacter sp.]